MGKKHVRNVKTRKETEKGSWIHGVQFHDRLVQYFQLGEAKGEFEIFDVVLFSAVEVGRVPSG